MKRVWRWDLAVALSSHLAGATAFAQTNYAFTLIPDVPNGSNRCVSYGVNNAGQVSGMGSSGGSVYAFRWSVETGMRELPPLPGHVLANAFAINPFGDVAGASNHTTTDHTQFVPVVWDSAGAPQQIALPPEYTGAGAAYGINQAGQICGSAVLLDGDSGAFFWDPSVGATTLPDFPDGRLAEARSLNGDGLVAGSGDRNGDNVHACRWDVGGQIFDLGALPSGDGSSQTTSVSESGFITGVADAGGRQSHAFLWSPATGMRDLGVLPGDTQSAGFAVNAAGVVVGFGRNGGDPHAIIGDSAGGLRLLSDLVPGGTGPWTLSSANAISDNGYIVGVASNAQRHERVYLLTPIANPDCRADLNQSGSVDLADLAILLSHFGASDAAPGDGDLDDDGDVDVQDLATLLSRFGTLCP